MIDINNLTKNQVSAVHSVSFAHYLQNCVTQIYRALYGDAMLNLCPSEGQKHGSRKLTATSVPEFCY